jgi:hypothetical protein
MSTAENAKLQYEAGQTSYAMSTLTNSGDGITFTSSASLWSRKSGYTPVVRPNGLLTGGAITPDAAAANDKVDIAALTCNLNGVVTSVAAGELTASRGAASDTHRITSLTVNSSGSLAAVAGVDGTAFSETRGADGGPPLIAVDSIEIGQVRVTSTTSAVITSSEIFAVPGTHLERADYPLYTIDYANGKVVFSSANPSIHTGPTVKRIYASYAAPIFADIQLVSDFVPPETTHSVTSTQVYGSTIGSSSSTLGQGSFTAYLTDGVTDPLVSLKNSILWFKFYPDRYQSSYMVTQGKLGVARTFPAADSIQAACTISADSAAVEVS